MKRWKFALAFAAVFVAGVIVGGLIVMRLIPPPFGPNPTTAAKMTERMMSMLKTDLNLRPDQEEKIKPVIARTTEQAVGFHRELSTRIQAAIDSSDLEIEGFMDSQQKAKFEKLRAKRPRLPTAP
jgi:uncharacterized protein YneF (UPF0154 family)